MVTRMWASCVLVALCCSAVAARGARPLGAAPATRALLGATEIDVDGAKYTSEKSYLSDPDSMLFVPQSDEANETFPAVVFAHGLCGGAELYDDLMSSIAGAGFVVIANRKQESCESPSIWNPFSIFTSMGNLRENADGSEMVSNLKKDYEYLKTRPDIVDATKIALVGHSMGGGAVIDLAAKLEEADQPVQAVAAIAPWNGIPKIQAPSTVANKIKAPVLLFCSKNDQICPCSGPIGLASGIGSSWSSYAMLRSVFDTSDNTWGGGVEAIYGDLKGGEDEGSNATLVEFDNGGHFALAGVTEDQVRGAFKSMDRSGLGGAANILIDSMVGMGESVSNEGKDAAALATSDVKNITIAFLEDKVAGEDESGYERAVQEAEGNDGVTIKTK